MTTGAVSLLAIETAGNQAFVYRSPRLKEAVGASALIKASCTEWVSDALTSHPSVEVVVATSGKAVLLGDRADLVAVLREVTLRSLAQAPGLDIAGGIVDIDDDGFFPALSRGFTALARNRFGLRGPEVRFRRLPIVDACASTGLPAAAVARIGSDSRLLGHEAIAKRNAAEAGWSGMATAVDGIDFTRSIDRLEMKSSKWTAVVHADGSGMGQLFLSFDAHLRQNGQASTASDVHLAADSYRRLSHAIERCTEAAWQDAARSVGRADSNAHEHADIVPILLGGDDITVVADGGVALPFAIEYLRAFERETREHQALQNLGVGQLSAGAAVVWTKPGFPFSVSYQLAEQRLKRAKETAKAHRAQSVLDVHVLYDTSIDHSDSGVSVDRGVRLTGNPYTLDEHDSFASINTLQRLVEGLSHAQVPSSQVHELRSLLSTVGVDAAQRRLDELKVSHPHLHQLISPLATNQRVMLLDALDLADVASSRSHAKES